jgi:hypothetical protein
MEPEKIILPYSVAEVIKEQKKLIKETPRRRYVGRQLHDADIKTLATYLQWKCGLDIPASFFLSSLDSFRYRTIEDATLQHFLCRLVAVLALNEVPLRPVEPWMVQERDEWVPFEVLSVSQKDHAVYVFQCRALGSKMWGHVFDYRVSLKMAFRMASRAGFNQRDELKRMHDPRQFTDLRLVLHIAKGSVPGKVKVLDCGIHAATVTYNQNINKLRDPVLRKCPYQQRTTCFRCGIGKDKCELAVIATTVNKGAKNGR